jgi:hypothetical protein
MYVRDAWPLSAQLQPCFARTQLVSNPEPTSLPQPQLSLMLTSGEAPGKAQESPAKPRRLFAPVQPTDAEKQRPRDTALVRRSAYPARRSKATLAKRIATKPAPRNPTRGQGPSISHSVLTPHSPCRQCRASHDQVLQHSRNDSDVALKLPELMCVCPSENRFDHGPNAACMTMRPCRRRLPGCEKLYTIQPPAAEPMLTP